MTYVDSEDRAQAAEFAKRWYERLPSGCSEGTLACLLEEELAKARDRARMDLTAMTLANLAKAMGFEATVMGKP